MKSENVNFYIPTLKNGDKTATAHQDKANILLQYYTNLFNSNPPRMNIELGESEHTKTRSRAVGHPNNRRS